MYLFTYCHTKGTYCALRQSSHPTAGEPFPSTPTSAHFLARFTSSHTPILVSTTPPTSTNVIPPPSGLNTVDTDRPDNQTRQYQGRPAHHCREARLPLHGSWNTPSASHGCPSFPEPQPAICHASPPWHAMPRRPLLGIHSPCFVPRLTASRQFLIILVHVPETRMMGNGPIPQPGDPRPRTETPRCHPHVSIPQSIPSHRTRKLWHRLRLFRPIDTQSSLSLSPS
ncbi:uncharacterized protein LY79DRAFT_222940 [Colletotrichum navitas]|uniref:Uncharacterized protein n=1 Tax=Colletotrichum navitas TaxID=681940 RepID=A0AAD8V2S3_9PEZI|nr:uncharacterized protein LY79DRAFT_222940 [Colletotrichum navitas]KAK1590130.1 hypothetical protein LY79DRAFT_222940 [Colletotrichum navitas]